MAKFQGVIFGLSRTGAGFTGGITGTSTYALDDRIFKESTTSMWDAACFGISVTTIGTQSFSCYLVTTIEGVQVPIAGLSGIGTTTTTVLPLVNERVIGTVCGSTQSAFNYGFPVPRSVVFANSSTPGQSFSAVVVGMLYKTT